MIKLVAYNKTSGLIAGVLCCLSLQLQLTAQGAQGGFTINNFYHSVQVVDESGKSFVNPYREAGGSPYLRDVWTHYLRDVWTHATLRVNGNVIVPDMRIRLDLKSQQWHFLDSGNIERLIPPGLVREALLDDSSGADVKTTVFRSGFPPVDSRKITDFYQVLSDGKVQLLHSMQKVIDVDKDEMSGSVQKEFVLYEEYYVFSGGKMWRIRKDKSEVQDQLADKREKILTFISEKHLKLKSIVEIMEVIDYYNTIP
jgi:hypothetical protein